MKIRLSIYFLSLFTILSLLCGCNTTDPFAYCNAPFSATAEGTINELPFQARIYCDFSVHDTKEVYTLMNVAYLSPESLHGITVTLTSDGRSYTRLNDMEMGEQSLRGMTEIFHLLCPQKPVTSLKQNKEQLEMKYSDDQNSYTIFFKQSGSPPSRIEGIWQNKSFSINLSGHTVGEVED